MLPAGRAALRARRRPPGRVVADVAQRIDIVEVGPRDGLQNEDMILDTDAKLALIDHLVRAGMRRIEAVSFSHPDYVPQMADAEAVMAGVDRDAGVRYIGLVMNRRGWQRAVDAGVDEVNVPIFATETFNRENQGAPIGETHDVLAEIAADARGRAIPVSVTIGVAWGCPFEGEVSLDAVVELATRLAKLDIAEIALADTIGVADPWAVTERIEATRRVIGDIPLRVHFHDTRATGIANAYAAIGAGITTIDASVGGVGGCPFAPAATGNIATEDLVYMLDRAGLVHGIDLGRLLEASGALSRMLGKELPAALPSAGGFPQGSSAAHG